MKMMTQGAWQAEVTGFGFKGGQLSITVRDPFLGEQEVYNASACSLRSRHVLWLPAAGVVLILLEIGRAHV